MMSVAKSLPALTEKTFFPLSLVIIALGAVAGGAWWLSAMYANQIEVNHRLDRIERSILESNSNAVTEHDMRVWVMALKAQNESVKIPEWVR